VGSASLTGSPFVSYEVAQLLKKKGQTVMNSPIGNVKKKTYSKKGDEQQKGLAASNICLEWEGISQKREDRAELYRNGGQLRI